MVLRLKILDQSYENGPVKQFRASFPHLAAENRNDNMYSNSSRDRRLEIVSRLETQGM